MLVLLVVKVGLKIVPFNRFRKIFARFNRVRKVGFYPAQYVDDTAWAVRTAAHVLPLALTCLPQALTVKYLLRRDPDMPLHIGVERSDPGGFRAHAWVEKEGRIIIGNWPDEETYQPIWVWQ